MFLGRDSPGKEKRVEYARNWVHARSPYAIVAGLLGIFAPIDGIIFFPLSLLAVIVGFLGLRDLRENPQRLGRRLCFLGIIGGALGLIIAGTLQIIPAPTPPPPPTGGN